MTNRYTENQIVKFIFKECDLFDKLEMEFAMDEDSSLMDSYNKFMEGYNLLPKIHFSPKQSSIDSILKYCKAGCV